ncbi:MAG: hypothetical protein H9Q65_00885 [Spiroplasma ixodetis]|nr:hypothetical protein [Spiroplasma ixodetis]
MLGQYLTNIEHQGQDPKWLLIGMGVIGISIILCLIDYLIKKIKNKKKRNSSSV